MQRILYSSVRASFICSAAQPLIASKLVYRLNSSSSSSSSSRGKGGSFGDKSNNRGDLFSKDKRVGNDRSRQEANSSPSGNLFKNKQTRNNNKQSLSGNNHQSWTENLRQVAKKVTGKMSDQLHGHLPGGSGDHEVAQQHCVVHEPHRDRFVMDLGNNKKAWIDYKKASGDNTRCCLYDLYHTEVPEELRGQGLGRALAQGALDELSRQGVKVKLSCSYLVNFVKQHAPNKYSSMIETHPNKRR